MHSILMISRSTGKCRGRFVQCLIAQTLYHHQDRNGSSTLCSNNRRILDHLDLYRISHSLVLVTDRYSTWKRLVRDIDISSRREFALHDDGLIRVNCT